MSRRPDPERIFEPRKAATITRLVGDGIQRDQIERWVDSWEGEATDNHDLRRDPEFWRRGYAWAKREYDARRKPPPPRDTSSDPTE